ncbi:MAG: TOMM precursor leader peptide-binding protein [Solirubrobacterales bacterium]
MKTFASARPAEVQRPRLRRTLQRVDVQDAILLLDPGSRRDLQIDRPDPEARGLLEALDGTRTRQELDQLFDPGKVTEALSALGQWGALEDAADEDLIEQEVLGRFDRQLRYFSDVSGGPAPSECQARLEQSAVAVLGIGGLGGWSALALAGCGIGKMLLLDGDRIELSNLNRQVVYGEGDIGRLKVEAAAERLASLNSDLELDLRPVRIESEADVGSAIAGYDVVIDAVDSPAHDIEHWVNRACFQAGIPYIGMSHAPPLARVGPFYVPGMTGCYACQEIAYRREFEHFDAMVEHLRASPSPASIVAPLCAQIGGHVALDLLHFLTGLAEPSTLGAAAVYDARTMEHQRVPVQREPMCPVCGGEI